MKMLKLEKKIVNRLLHDLKLALTLVTDSIGIHMKGTSFRFHLKTIRFCVIYLSKLMQGSLLHHLSVSVYPAVCLPTFCASFLQQVTHVFLAVLFINALKMKCCAPLVQKGI